MKRRWLKRVARVATALFCLGVAWSVLFLRFSIVPTGAMENTIIPGDHILSNRLMGKPKRGDVVIFRYPQDPSVLYVMRIVGMPGERIQLDRDKVIINGKELAEHRVYVARQSSEDPRPLQQLSSAGSGPYTVYYQQRPEEPRDPVEDRGVLFGGSEPYTVPPDEYFVLGDNRDNSEDSRYFGTVPARLILSKAFLIYWSDMQGATAWSRVGSRVK